MTRQCKHLSQWDPQVSAHQDEFPIQSSQHLDGSVVHSFLRPIEQLVYARWALYASFLIHIPTDGRGGRPMDDKAYQWSSYWVPQAFTYYPLMCPFMEITCTTCPKTLLHVYIFHIWICPKISESQLQIFSIRKAPALKGLLLALHCYISTKPPPF